MNKQRKIIQEFCKDASYYMIKYSVKDDEEFGKIIKNEELKTINLKNNEVYRSVEYKDGNMLFVFNLLPEENNHMCNNPLELLMNNITLARAIEGVYPNIFTWVFNGISINAYAIVPSGDIKANSTLTRYGGTTMFVKILKQHLRNIGKIHNGIVPDFRFLQSHEKIEESELSIGSINIFNSLYSVPINLEMNYSDVIYASKYNITKKININVLDMKFWVKEVNPDFINEAKHIKLKNTLPLEWSNDYYPDCIKKIINLKRKGNYNRFLLTKFLLSVHNPKDAKFIYNSVLANEELEHIRQGNCSTQWNYILNNMKRYNCPTCSQLNSFCNKECPLSHPLQKIQEELKKK